MNDITVLDSWVISAQGHFTKNTDLFPRKVSNNLNGCPMKAVVRDLDWFITAYNDYEEISNVSVLKNVGGFEVDLLMIILYQMNKTFVNVLTEKYFDEDNFPIDSLFRALILMDAYIALVGIGNKHLNYSFLDATNTYLRLSIGWYVPCSVKYPRWSSIFRILSVELWLVLIISIVLAAISVTLVGRYSCTSEWQAYKTLKSLLTNVWAVLLGVSVSTMPRAPSVRCLFLAWVCCSLAFSTVFQSFLKKFLVDSGYKTPIQNMEELFASGIKLAYDPEHNFVFENADETEVSIVQTHLVICPSVRFCENWAIYQKNVSALLYDLDAEVGFSHGDFVGQNSEPLLCMLDDGVYNSDGIAMIMIHGDPLLRRVSEIIDRVVAAGLYTFWISKEMNLFKLHAEKIAFVN